MNEEGQLGINSFEHTKVPIKIENELAGKLVVKISCGLNFSVAILDSGEVGGDQFLLKKEKVEMNN